MRNQSNLLVKYLCVESRPGHAQAGVLCNDCICRELVPLRDIPPGGPDPCQEGCTFQKRKAETF